MFFIVELLLISSGLSNLPPNHFVRWRQNFVEMHWKIGKLHVIPRCQIEAKFTSRKILRKLCGGVDFVINDPGEARQGPAILKRGEIFENLIKIVKWKE